MSKDRSVDPRDIPRPCNPSVIEFTDGLTQLVADADVRDSGWVYCRDWDGVVRYFPPQELAAIQRLETDSFTDEERGPRGERYHGKLLADEDLIAQIEAQDEDTEVIA